MYGYKTKQRIIDYYMKEMLAKKPITPPVQLSLRDMATKIPGTDENKAATYILEMKFEGYFDFIDQLNDQLVTITPKGLEVGTTKYFERKYKEVLWRSVMNISITAANIIVAIAAIIALWVSSDKENERLRKAEDRLQAIEQTDNKAKGITSPKIPHSKPPLKTNSKDSLPLKVIPAKE